MIQQQQVQPTPPSPLPALFVAQGFLIGAVVESFSATLLGGVIAIVLVQIYLFGLRQQQRQAIQQQVEEFREAVRAHEAESPVPSDEELQGRVVTPGPGGPV